MSIINRRGLIAGAAGAGLYAGIGPRPLDAAEPGLAAGLPMLLHEATNVAAQLSPDRGHVALDALGVLWVVPAGGGPARRLTSDLFDVAQPDWASDGSLLTFQAYRDGVFNLWLIRPDGSGLRQLTRGPYDHREPRFAPDGRRIAFSSDRSGSYGLYLLDLATGGTTVAVDTAAQEYEPCWSPDGLRLAFVVDNTRIDVVELASGIRSTAVSAPAGTVLHAPQWTPDGAELVYYRFSDGRTTLERSGSTLVAGADIFPFRVSWRSAHEFLYTADGGLRVGSLTGGPTAKIPFTLPVTLAQAPVRRRQRDFDGTTPQPVRGIGSPVLSPDGRQVAFRALNDIYLLRIGASARPVTRDRWWKQDPAWSPDGRHLSYSTDRGGKLDIWLRDLVDGTDRQLTALPDAAAVSATWSPDGSRLAFLDQTGALYTVDVATGAIQQVFTATFEPGRPTWSPDGSVIALAAVVPYSARFREGLSKILLVNRVTGAARYVEPLPGRSLQTRGDDGPVWSPDGTRMAFVVGSVLWVVDVHPDGTPAGAPRQITAEVTDAPSWSGDSSRLLYLHNGELRLVSATGGPARTVPTGLTWTNTAPRGRIVIQAGRLWDGRSQSLRTDVDVVVEGHRVVAVEPRRPGRDGRIVDARGLVVAPGLVDMHHHRQMQGYSYGDRQGRLWLSLGVTTTRSPGSPAYHMVEERESVQSGARVAPRYFGTGEAIDGSRVYYNFMRPTVDERQLALELQRAGALDYDLMKAYVRLSPEWQREVIAWAHRHHIPATSHYHYPAFAAGFAGDGMEHYGATSRFGYSRTVSAVGAGYRDVIDVFTATGAARTPTLFGAVTLLREDDSLVEDRRVKTLYPPWEYAALLSTMTAARTTDQTATRDALAREVAQFAAILRGGGRVISGTDSPIANMAVSLHLNLRALVRYGMTPYEALLTATSIPGEQLAEPLGQLGPGVYADLVILGGDPLTDIRAAADVRQVMSNGTLYTVDELLAPFATMRTAARPANEVLPPVPPHPANERFWWHDPRYVRDGRSSCCIHV